MYISYVNNIHFMYICTYMEHFLHIMLMNIYVNIHLTYIICTLYHGCTYMIYSIYTNVYIIHKMYSVYPNVLWGVCISLVYRCRRFQCVYSVSSWDSTVDSGLNVSMDIGGYNYFTDDIEEGFYQLSPPV